MHSVGAAPLVVIVGLCPHGLTMARALRNAGIRVIALESDASLPGTHTNSAEVRIVPGIDGQALIEALAGLAETARWQGKPALLLTNDRQVESVARHVRAVTASYSVPWAESADTLVRLQRKDAIEGRCSEVGLRYPRTRQITDTGRLGDDIGTLRFPVIFKPTKPLSAFKTCVIHSWDGLPEARSVISGSMPVIAQEFVPGDESEVRFGALYLVDGEVAARFEGRKLRARPMGHTTVAVPERSDEVHELTRRFFDGLRVTGFVSLEMKRDTNGDDWVIEPTVGRTDFWIGLCIANGVDFPLIEVMGPERIDRESITQRHSHLWINEERDQGAFPWILFNRPGLLLRYRVRGVMFDFKDNRPWLVALWQFISKLPGRVRLNLSRMARQRTTA